MATTAIDRKLLGNLAALVSRDHDAIGSDLFILLGLSVGLGDRITTMRRYLKSTNTPDVEMTALRYHILVLVREGIAMVETRIAPFTDVGQFGLALQIMTVKLRASFYHMLCLYHNKPPIVTRSVRKAKRGQAETAAITHTTQHRPVTLPHHPIPLNSDDPSSSPPEITVTSSDGTSASLNTNPWAPATLPPQPYAHNLPPFPTGNAATFIIPLRDNIPTTLSLFETTLDLATQLPGSAPLRLSVMVDFCSFLRLCLKDEPRAKKLASEAVRAVYEAGEGMEDHEFDDAAALVALLGAFVGDRAGGGAEEGEKGE
jgi:hypothetical protein